MADHEKDDVSLLSDTHPKLVDEEVDSRFSPFLSRNQSASISIPVNSMESYGFENNLGGYTGPLHRERKAPLVQMSGPLYINRNTENLFLANHGVTARKKVEPKPERCQSFKGMDPSGWDDVYTDTNAHLMRSGQLGMCNDPYCTTCPSYYDSKDSRVCFCSNIKKYYSFWSCCYDILDFYCYFLLPFIIQTGGTNFYIDYD